MEQEKRIFICDDNLDGIFTAIYDAWRLPARGIQVEICTTEVENYVLFSSLVYIKSSVEKSTKVLRTIRKKLGISTYQMICHAALAANQEKATAIFYILYRALGQERCNTRIMEEIADENVNLILQLYKKVWREIHHYFGFVRFQEIGKGVFFSEIAPKNDVLVMLKAHFVNRFPNENWVIYDNKRKKALCHLNGRECQIYQDVELNWKQRDQLSESGEYEQLWRVFCKSIAIEERKNEKLQKQLMPLRFRTHMTEFCEVSSVME